MSQHPLSQTTQEQNSGSNAGGADHNGNLGPDDPGGLDPVLNLHDEDSFYFDFGIFDNSTDWLRDWGPNDSISPDSQPGIESLEALPEASFNFGPTPGNYNCGGGGGEALSLTAVSNARDQHPATPMPVPPEDVAGLTPRPPHISEDGSVLVPGLPTVSPMKDYATSTDFLPWGWQHGLREAPSRKVTLPPLRQVLTERSGDAKNSRYAGQHSPISNDPPAFDEAGTITERMRKDMIGALILPSTHPPYPGCDIAEIERAFPNKEVIAVFIKLYFEQFHPILPVIHRPSFCIERCPSVLLLAMVSIGASYSNLKNSKAFADSLSELCKRYLVWMAESDPTYGRSAFYLQSMCLQNLYAMGSGSTNLYDAADVSRSVLIGNARRIGLFSGAISSPASSSPSSAPNSPALHPVNGRFSPNHDQGYDRHESPLALEARWRDWREKEGLKRLAWGIFEYDSSFSTLSNRRGAITISDITIRLPCSESLWQAATAASWQALLAQEPEIRGFQFYSTLKLIIAGRFDVDTLTSWGKRICAQAMGRIMWDFKELEESVLSVGPFGKTSFKPQKEMMLRSLMLVCESSTPRAGEAEGDRYHWILARLIAHYTHLHAAFPTISLMLGLARKPPRQGAETTDHRIKRLKNLLATDPAGARTLAWHAAQIIALSRWKPVFSPVEGMRLFLAGVVLWGFANYHRSDSMSSCGSSVSSAQSGTYPGRPEDVVRLDLLPWNTPSGCSGKEEEWIRYGRGKATIGIGAAEGDRMMEVCGEDGAKEVLRVVVGILGSLRVWGLGGEFKGVLEELVARKS
ncbi:hypothetical protein K440DRAFT_561894 [Wilcoxina mikolae CBS 423.85]|nr:hypothetical protein K440DRAFT_561894 [Wilcoxina mikolae CBS 423.85]